MSKPLLIVLLTLLLSVSPSAIATRATGCDTTSDIMLVSVKTGGEPVESYVVSDLSDDARFIAFLSDDSTIVPNDTNNTFDVFLHDRQNCTTTLVNRTPSGEPGDPNSGNYNVFLSSNGRHVAFTSAQSDLVLGDTGGYRDGFIYDHETKIVERVTYGMGGSEANGDSVIGDMSSDGRFIVFGSAADNIVPGDSNGENDVFLLDRLTDNCERVSLNSLGEEANDESWPGHVSDDGRVVSYTSLASNLSLRDSRTILKALARDRNAGTTTLVSVNSLGDPANNFVGGEWISDDGRFVLMYTWATNLHALDVGDSGDGYGYDRVTGQTFWATPRDPSSFFYAHAWDVSADHRFILVETPDSFSALDPNGQADIYLFDRLTSQYFLQSRWPNESAAFGTNPHITPDHRFVVYHTVLNPEVSPDEMFVAVVLARTSLPPAELNADLDWQGRPTPPHDSWIAPVRVILTPAGETTPLFDSPFTTDDSGAFTIGHLPAGEYTLWVKGSNTLAARQSISLADGANPITVDLLRAGDASGDNQVGIGDFSLLALAFGTARGEAGFDDRADFNGDGAVNIADFSLLAANWGTSGEPPPG
ncbi:MAG: hypothetical protein IPK19_34825 [Chloroflexi bacterium]|nr:hypothetical protein [Chloroflexota bacterium]